MKARSYYKILLPCGINDVGAAGVVEVVLKYEGAAAVGAGVAEGVLVNEIKQDGNKIKWN